jgi:EpsI family protein
MVLLALAGSIAADYGLQGPERFEPSGQLGFERFVPDSMGGWQRMAVRDPADLPEAAQVNEFFQAMYGHPEFGRFSLTLEYTADSRRRYELHYPDVCHGVRGDRLVVYPPRVIDVGEPMPIEAALMEWQHPDLDHQALAVYWYVTSDGVTADSVRLKWDQALAGLLRRPEAAVMFRIDGFFDEALTPLRRDRLLVGVEDLVRSLSRALDEPDRALLFTELPRKTSS